MGDRPEQCRKYCRMLKNSAVCSIQCTVSAHISWLRPTNHTDSLHFPHFDCTHSPLTNQILHCPCLFSLPLPSRSIQHIHLYRSLCVFGSAFSTSRSTGIISRDHSIHCISPSQSAFLPSSILPDLSIFLLYPLLHIAISISSNLASSSTSLSCLIHLYHV